MDGVNYIVYILFSMKNEYHIPPTGHLIKIIYKRVWFTRKRTKPVDTINNNNRFNMSRLYVILKPVYNNTTMLGSNIL